MRILPLLLAAALLAGCTEPAPPPGTTAGPGTPCAEQLFATRMLFLADGHTLANATAKPGQTQGNSATAAFVGDPQPWMGAPVPAGLHLEGNVSLTLYMRLTGASPFVSPAGSSSWLFIQFGSDRTYASGGAIVQAPPVGQGAIVVNTTIALLPGGFTLEAGDRPALLVTSLAQGAGDSGSAIEYGTDKPSAVTFPARCSEPRDWLVKRDLAFPVVIPANQGAFAGVPAQDGVNRLTFLFDLEAGAARLTVSLRAPVGPVKHDIDLFLLDSSGKVLYEAATPFQNETMVLWPENLAAFLPPATYQVRVDAYSGTNYSGKLRVVMDELPES
ncbi:MAG: hypothetical protein ABR562_04875 [Thermoplasmatota archaeon]|nr:hypothetical protein [Halobacteriales archaeon]